MRRPHIQLLAKKDVHARLRIRSFYGQVSFDHMITLVLWSDEIREKSGRKGVYAGSQQWRIPKYRTLPLDVRGWILSNDIFRTVKTAMRRTESANSDVAEVERKRLTVTGLIS